MEKKRGRKPKLKLQDVKEFVDGQFEGVKPPKGLGDTLEKVFEATGVAKAVKWLAGEDCGCDKRKEKLNQLFPYRKANCLTEVEFSVLDNYFKRHSVEITPSDQYALLQEYNRALNLRQEPTSCSSCWRDIMMNLRNLYNTYDDANS